MGATCRRRRRAWARRIRRPRSALRDARDGSQRARRGLHAGDLVGDRRRAVDGAPAPRPGLVRGPRRGPRASCARPHGGRDDRGGKARRRARRAARCLDRRGGGGRRHDDARRPARSTPPRRRPRACSRAEQTSAASQPGAMRAALRRRSCSAGSRRARRSASRLRSPMSLAFGSSDPLTLGVEEEVLLVDARHPPPRERRRPRAGRAAAAGHARGPRGIRLRGRVAHRRLPQRVGGPARAAAAPRRGGRVLRRGRAPS